MKVLFSSLAAKIALFKKVEAQVRNINPSAIVVGGDMDPQCLGAKILDKSKFLRMKKLDDFSTDEILKFLVSENISYVIPTRDGELTFWAVHKEILSECKISVMISDLSSIKKCNDKLTFYNSSKELTIPVIPTFLDLNEIDSKTFVVKSRYGSGSSNIGLNLSREEAYEHAKKINDPVFQPYIKGREFSAETWIDDKGQCHGLVMRWRLQIVRGESHESKIFLNDNWGKLIIDMFEKIRGLQGHCLAQIIVDENCKIHLIEINPRLGGASPLSLEAGLNSIEWFLNESNGASQKIPKNPTIRDGLRLKKKNGVVTITEE